MRKKLFVLFIIIVCVVFPTQVLANSSWHWISRYRPYDLLPYVIVLTLIIEIAVIYRFGKLKGFKITALVVIIANLISYYFPYLATMIPAYEGEIFPVFYNVDHWPSYTVGLGYLFITLVIELPIIYNVLKIYTENKQR